MSQLRSITLRNIGAGVALAVLPFVAAHAEDRCAVPQPGVAMKACAAARQGATELRRFVDRTRMIYGLYYWDYAGAVPETLAGNPEDRTVAALTDASNGRADRR